jgi:hypothetical protein
MSAMKFIVILAIAIIGIAYFYPAQYESGKDKIFSWFSSNKQINQPSTTNQTKVVPKVTTQEVNTPIETVTPENATPETSQTVTTDDPIQQEICSRVHSDYPDYTGTNKAGLTCADAAFDKDYECLMSPPTRYDGSINRVARISNPQINCCVPNGKCYWS